MKASLAGGETLFGTILTLGRFRQLDHPELRSAIERVLEAAQAAGGFMMAAARQTLARFKPG